MREHIIHSALVSHLTTNFQRKFKEESGKIETLKICQQVYPNSHKGLFHMPDYMVYWMLCSDYLKVEDEHTVLSFIFHYTKLQSERKGFEAAVTSANMLAKSLRFNFIDIYNIMSAVRKNHILQ